MSLLVKLMLLWTCTSLMAAEQVKLVDLKNYQQFAKKMEDHGVKKSLLKKWFGQRTINQDIINRMNKPAEKRPWYWYQDFFLTTKRIQLGQAFIKEKEAILAQEERDFHVPKEVVASIIGVESLYGRITGQYSVLDALSTLSFCYPKRARFFMGELETLIELSQKQNLDIESLQGSYAGAFGWAQFIPSSYRDFAQKHDKKHLYADLVKNANDNIMSIGYYLKHRGHWHAGEPIAEKALLKKVIPFSLRHRLHGDQLIKTDDPLYKELQTYLHMPSHPPEAILVVEQKPKRMSLWFAHHNFFAIRSYNISSHYALAVYELSNHLKDHGSTEQNPTATS